MSTESQSQAKQLSEEGLDLLFREARSQNGWLPEPVSEELIREVYELAKMGPTSANASPARFLFLTSDEAKGRLVPHMMEANRPKTGTAPVVVILAFDTEFYDQLPKLFPHRDMRPYFAGNQALADETAFRNSTLQAAYFILAARALGLDCGPMSGFDVAKVNEEFFPDGKWKVNFICGLGYGDPSKVFPRSPRLSFEEACQVL
jgi:3-hydroxypropanoate dehydrogenase